MRAVSRTLSPTLIATCCCDVTRAVLPYGVTRMTRAVPITTSGIAGRS